MRATRRTTTSFRAPENIRCTQATLEALGIFGERPIHGTGVLEVLIKHFGRDRIIWTTQQLQTDLITRGATTKQLHPRSIHGTVSRFVEQHPVGSFYLSTSGHAMALVDGVLTDTAGRGADGRHVQSVIEIV